MDSQSAHLPGVTSYERDRKIAQRKWRPKAPEGGYDHSKHTTDPFKSTATDKRRDDVKTDYNSIYTSPIDKNYPAYSERVTRADRMVRQIEEGATSESYHTERPVAEVPQFDYPKLMLEHEEHDEPVKNQRKQKVSQTPYLRSTYDDIQQPRLRSQSVSTPLSYPFQDREATSRDPILQRLSAYEPSKTAVRSEHMLRCELRLLGCKSAFSARATEEWIAHSIAHFAHHGPPEWSSCTICGDIFQSAKPDFLSRRENWWTRMNHIAHHLKEDFINPSSTFQADPQVLDYIKEKSITVPDTKLRRSSIDQEYHISANDKYVRFATSVSSHPPPEEDDISTNELPQLRPYKSSNQKYTYASGEIKPDNIVNPIPTYTADRKSRWKDTEYPRTSLASIRPYNLTTPLGTTRQSFLTPTSSTINSQGIEDFEVTRDFRDRNPSSNERSTIAQIPKGTSHEFEGSFSAMTDGGQTSQLMTENSRHVVGALTEEGGVLIVPLSKIPVGDANSSGEWKGKTALDLPILKSVKGDRVPKSKSNTLQEQKVVHYHLRQSQSKSQELQSAKPHSPKNKFHEESSGLPTTTLSNHATTVRTESLPIAKSISLSSGQPRSHTRPVRNFISKFSRSFLDNKAIRDQYLAMTARSRKKSLHLEFRSLISSTCEESVGKESHIVWRVASVLCPEIMSKLAKLSGSLTEDNNSSKTGSELLREASAMDKTHVADAIPSDKDAELALKTLSHAKFWQSSRYARNFVACVKQIYHDGNEKMRQIENLISAHVIQGNDTSVNICLEMDWNLPMFMHTQYDKDRCPKIGSVIAITGSALYCQATTCREYLYDHWLEEGPIVLRNLQNALNSNTYTATDETPGRSFAVLLADTTTIQITAPRKSAIAQMQIMAWLGTVLRLNDIQEISYSTCEISCYSVSDWRMQFKTSELVNEEKLCWKGLFHNPLIARGFPISTRPNDELGLEAPIQIMAALCGARSAVEHEGGLVVKGIATVLVPVKREGTSIHWHLLSNKNGKRIKYNQIGSRWPQRLLLGGLDEKSIFKTRAFLSWSERSESFIGTQSIEYFRINASRARELSSTVRLTDIQVGFQNFGTLGLGFAIGAKDMPIFPRCSSRLEKELDSADDLSICLYDVTKRRAWLVSGTETLLYMAQIKQLQKPYKIDGQPVPLNFAKISGDGTASCRRAIMDMASRPLISNRETAKEDYCVKDLISDLYSYLEIVEKATCEEASGISIKLRLKKTLQGFDLLDLAFGKSKWRRREVEVANSHGGWPTMIKKAQTPVLFGNYLGELLQPADRFQSPMILPTLPGLKDFLAMSTSRLHSWFEDPHANGTLDHFGIGVHIGSKICKPCDCNKNDVHKCPRLLQISSKSTVNKHFIKPHRSLSNKGCVIIGQSRGGLISYTARAAIAETTPTSMTTVTRIPAAIPSGTGHFYQDTGRLSPDSGSSNSGNTTADESIWSMEEGADISSPPTSVGQQSQHIEEPKLSSVIEQTRPLGRAQDCHNGRHQREAEALPHYRPRESIAYTGRSNHRPTLRKTTRRISERA